MYKCTDLSGDFIDQLGEVSRNPDCADPQLRVRSVGGNSFSHDHRAEASVVPDGNPAHRRLAHDAIISLDKGMLHQPARAGAVAFLIDDSGVDDRCV